MIITVQGSVGAAEAVLFVLLVAPPVILPNASANVVVRTFAIIFFQIINLKRQANSKKIVENTSWRTSVSKAGSTYFDYSSLHYYHDHSVDRLSVPRRLQQVIERDESHVLTWPHALLFACQPVCQSISLIINSNSLFNKIYLWNSSFRLLLLLRCNCSCCSCL